MVCDSFSYFPNISSIEASITMTVKVADKNTEVVGKAFKRGARKIAFDVCEIPKRTYHSTVSLIMANL